MLDSVMTEMCTGLLLRVSSGCPSGRKAFSAAITSLPASEPLTLFLLVLE